MQANYETDLDVEGRLAGDLAHLCKPLMPIWLPLWTTRLRLTK